MAAASRRRLVHPGAWWLWAGGLAAAAMRTLNPLLLGLILAVAAYVVAARRAPAPWARSFASFLKLGVFVIVLRLVVQILFGRRLPGTVLFELPSAELPSWAAGVTIGGPVTIEALVLSFCEGLRLAVVLACFGAVNSLCSPYRMLRCLPAVLYEAGVTATVALGFAPEAVASLGRLREARRLRGRPTRGLAGVRGMAMPVLEGALDRSIELASSMDARGYGRRIEASARARRSASLATGTGLLLVCVGVYALLDGASPSMLALPVLGAGSLALAGAMIVGGRRTPRTRYRPDPWQGAEWVTSLAGAAAFLGMFLAGRFDPAALEPVFFPLTPPTLPLVAVAGILVALLPAVATPAPPGLVAVPTGESSAPAPGPADGSPPPQVTANEPTELVG